MVSDSSTVTRTRTGPPSVRGLAWCALLALAVLLPLFAARPAAAVDQLHIVSRWTGNLPEHYFWNGAQFLGWNVIGGKTIVSPPALASYQGNVHLFAVSEDQKLYQAIWNGSSWAGWFDFSGPFASVGAAAVDYAGFLILVAVTPDNQLVLAYFDPNANQWQGFFPFASNVFGRPALAVHNGQLHVFVRGSSNNYFQQFYNGQQFSPFVDIGGPFASGPAAASFGGQLHVFGPSLGGELFEVTNQFQNFVNLGAPTGTTVEGSAAAANFANGVLVVLVRGANNGLFARTFSNGAWSPYTGSFGQALSGPATTFHQTGGGGGPGGPNHPPVFSSVVATRLVYSFGRDDAFRSEGLLGRPGITPGLQALLAPPIVTLDANGDGKLDALDPLVVAAGAIASCCTLLVAEGASDPDGNPVVFKWQAVTGTFYSTGDVGSGGVPFGQKITDVNTYSRNSIFWEAPSIGFPIVDELLMGGLTNVGVHVEDVPTTGPPLKSDTKFQALEWDRAIHLEIGDFSALRLPVNHPQHPKGIEMSFLADIKGSYNTGGLPMTIRFECGGKDHTVRQEPLIAGAPFKCQYDEDEENAQVTVTAVVTVGGGFIFATNGPGLDVWKSRGCTVGDTHTTQVKLTAVVACNDTQVAGGDTADSRFVEMGKSAATFQFDFETFSQQDRVIVTYQGSTLFDTGCVGANGSRQLSYSGTATRVNVQVIPNCAGGTGTSWNYTVHCPNP